MNTFFLTAEPTETTKTFWEVFVNTDELVGLTINVTLLLILGYVVFIFVKKYFDYNSILKSYSAINRKIEEEYDSMLLSKYDNSTNPFKKLISKYISTQKDGNKKSTAESQLKNQGDFEMARLGEKLGVLATCSGVATHKFSSSGLTNGLWFGSNLTKVCSTSVQAGYALATVMSPVTPLVVCVST